MTTGEGGGREPTKGRWDARRRTTTRRGRKCRTGVSGSVARDYFTVVRLSLVPRHVNTMTSSMATDRRDYCHSAPRRGSPGRGWDVHVRDNRCPGRMSARDGPPAAVTATINRSRESSANFPGDFVLQRNGLPWALSELR